MRLIAILLGMFLGLVCSDATEKTSAQTVNKNSSVDTIRLEKLPSIGDMLNESIRLTSKHGQSVSSSTISPAATILNNGIIFDIAWDKDSRVNYIVTMDSKFSTKENVRINMTLKDIKEIQKTDVLKMPGWGYYIQLKSGWFAGFCIGKTCTDRELKENDKVTFIFKR
jgi:hypothetical protein